MNLKIQTRHYTLSPSEKKIIERKAQKTRKMLPSFRRQDLELHLTLEKLSKGKQFETVLVLTTPQTAIRVEELEDSPTRSIVGAFDELFRKIKRFKSQLNRERFWKRKITRATEKTPPSMPPELIEEIINSSIEKVENYIRRELYHRALVENFPPGVIQPQALVDEVFLEVSSNVQNKPINLTVEQWMFQVARDIINCKVQELQAQRDEEHLEEATGTEERWEDEILNFYQPDEALRLEDLVKDDHSTTPEELLAREETEEEVQHIIAGLAPSVRESFVLFALEGFNTDEVAMITGKSRQQVLKHIEEAREHLRRHLAVG